MKKIFFAIIMMAMIITQNAYAVDLSSWADDDFKQMSRAGALEIDLLTGKMSDNISRVEFCNLIMNIYKSGKNITLDENDYGVFVDTDDTAVIEAYKAGIVNGKQDNIFDPYGPVTRQEMGVMISRMLKNISMDYNLYTNQVKAYNVRFLDSYATADWAVDDMAAICSYDIISGDENRMVLPQNFATKEQAVCMLNRVRTQFVGDVVMYTLPEIQSMNDKISGKNRIDITWNGLANVNSYSVVIKRLNAENTVVSIPSNQTYLTNYYIEPASDNIFNIYVCAHINNGVDVISLPLEIDNNIQLYSDTLTEEQYRNLLISMGIIQENTKTETQPQTPVVNEETDNRQVGVTEKEKRVFPDGYYFTSKDEAEPYMTQVTVPVWRLNADGSKSSSQKTIKVNQALADDVVNIFTEIYNDPSQFPIKDVGGYYWRNTASGNISQHSYGTCIDINYNENYYVKPDGTPVTGSYWKPGEDPYSIPKDSIVVKTFAKYGWLWGGNAWGPSYNKDYMHFTYLGK